MIQHGTERSRKEVTEYAPNADFTMPDGSTASICTGSHTYTQTEKYCRSCGWVTCKGIIDHIVCPSCHEQW